MPAINATSANNPRLPAAKPRTPRGVLTPTEWAEMRDALVLALDALGEGPGEVNRDFLANCIMHQRIAIKIAHGRMDKLRVDGE